MDERSHHVWARSSALVLRVVVGAHNLVEMLEPKEDFAFGLAILEKCASSLADQAIPPLDLALDSWVAW